MADDVIRFGKNVTPNRVTQKTRDDGTKDTYYSNKGDKDHGHTVQKPDGSIEYARTRGGNVIINKDPK